MILWLDGHYSAGLTYNSAKESPLLDELAAMRAHLSRLGDVAIFIDDIRCCVPPADQRQGGYPALDELVSWAGQQFFMADRSGHHDHEACGKVTGATRL